MNLNLNQGITGQGITGHQHEPFVRCDEHGRILGVCKKCGDEMVGDSFDEMRRLQDEVAELRKNVDYWWKKAMEAGNRPAPTA